MMTNTQLATASLDDIVFDGRNQGYGAYQLRALYQRHMTRALIIATAMLLLLLVFPLVAQLLKDPTPPVPPKHLETNTLIAPPLDAKALPPPPVVTPPPAAEPAQPKHLATVRFTPPVVVPNDQVMEDVPDQKALETAQVATVTKAGEESSVDISPLESVEGPKTVSDVVDSHVYISVEQMPELPSGGGQSAIVAAIQRAVKYPSLDLRNGVEGRVYASFTVNAKGEVVDLKVVKGLSATLDAETLRAIKSLPTFIPGKQNGREVNVSFTVPITYKIQ